MRSPGSVDRLAGARSGRGSGLGGLTAPDEAAAPTLGATPLGAAELAGIAALGVAEALVVGLASAARTVPVGSPDTEG
jgi:hypothetical protein